MKIVIDFDGTITSGDTYPEIGSIQLYAAEVIRGWYDEGNVIIINSCRTGRYEGMAVDFLQEHHIPFNYFNCNLPEAIVKYKMDSRKVCGDVYIDDKNVLGIPDWYTLDTLIRNHKLYTKLK